MRIPAIYYPFRVGPVALSLAFAVPAAAEPVLAWRDLGWPGGDARMVCRDVKMMVIGEGIPEERDYWFEVKSGYVQIRGATRSLKLDLLSTRLYPTGFEADAENVNRIRVKRKNYRVDFEQATFTKTIYYSLTFNSRVDSRTFDCEVEYAPAQLIRSDEEPTYAELLWDQLREIAARNAPADAAAPEAPLARSADEVRAAAEGAREMLAERPRALLRALSWFTESDAGKDYARSPNGRALALGHPRGRCPAIGAAKQALSHSALADAYGACVAALPEPPPDAPVGEACACAAAIVGNVLLADPATFDYEPRPRALLATAAEDGSGLEVLEVAIAGDPDDSAGMRIDDANGREICGGLRLGKEPFELRCVRFGGRYAARAELFGRRGMRGYGAALGIDAARAEGHPRRVLALFFHFEDAALETIRSELPELWSE